MRKTPTARRRPSPATAISLVALVLAMSGTAYAATGGTFILGKANKETSTASLSNSKGTPLALSAPAGKAPLTVSNSVLVPKLNATELDGDTAAAFLPATGTADNSDGLGGLPADHFLPADHLSGTLSPGNEQAFPVYGDAGNVFFSCTSNGLIPVAEITFTSLTSNAQVWWLNKDGEGYTTLNDSQSAVLAETQTNPYTVVAQIAWGSGKVATMDLSVAVNSTAENCTFAALQTSSG
jgi:hypothetical protein